MEWLSPIADVVGIAGALFALFAWIKARQVQQELEREKQRQNKKVTVVLQCGDKTIELPLEIRRAELTRAEILGRIGMIPLKKETGQERFKLRNINTPEFFRQINQVAAGDGDGILTIPCTDDEIRQFDL